MSKITFLVAKKTFSVANVTFSVVKITFVVIKNTYEVTDITFAVLKITFSWSKLGHFSTSQWLVLLDITFLHWQRSFSVAKITFRLNNVTIAVVAEATFSLPNIIFGQDYFLNGRCHFFSGIKSHPIVDITFSVAEITFSHHRYYFCSGEGHFLSGGSMQLVSLTKITFECPKSRFGWPRSPLRLWQILFFREL